MRATIVSDATMFAAQRGRNRDRSIPIRSTAEDYRLPDPNAFDPREESAVSIIWPAFVITLVLIGFCLIASIH